MQLPAQQWIDFLKQRNMVKSVCYSGGDPLAHPGFNQIMEWHIHNNLPFSIITAGFIPYHIEMSLLKHASSAAVSLDSIRGTVYKAQRGGVISVVDVKDGIAEMVKAGIRVKLGITVTSINQPYVHEVLQYAQGHGIDKVLVHPAYGSDIDLGINPHDWPDLNLWIYDYHDLDTGCQCAVPYYHAFIDAKGDIYHCCITAGDTRKESRSRPLGNIDNWYEYLANRSEFFRSWPVQATYACAECQDRLHNINKEVHRLNTKQIFF